jgi:hypothetical protein
MGVGVLFQAQNEGADHVLRNMVLKKKRYLQLKEQFYASLSRIQPHFLK